MAQERIYLDSQGGQSPSSAILAKAQSMLNLSWHDAKSRHFESSIAAQAQELALQSLSKSFGLTPSQVTPVHRLSNAFEVLGGLFPETAVSKTSRKAAFGSFSGPLLDVDNFGRITDLNGATSFTAPAANQETGVIENLENLIAKSNAFAIVDATEWIGRVEKLPVGDILIARASSWGGPNTACFLLSTSKNIEIEKRKAHSLKPSSHDLLWAATAFEELSDISQTENSTREFSKSICESLSKYESVNIHGDKHALPHLISFSIENIDSETAAIAFDKNGISVGSGSACGIESQNSSHVLEAMGIKCSGNIRISIPIDFTDVDLDKFLTKLPKVFSDLSQTL